MRGLEIKGVDIVASMGWSWFEYHAKQRLDVFKFYLTIYASSMVVGMAAFDRKYNYVSASMGIVSVLLCIIFWRIDIRSRRLIEIGEDMLSNVFRVC